MMEGLVPPQCIETEESVLGMLLIQSEAYDEVADIIDENIFYSPKNNYIFKAISYLHSNNTPIDLMSVTNRLKSTKKIDAIGGMIYVAELSQKVSTAINIDIHVKYLVEKRIRREAILLMQKSMAEFYNESIDLKDVLDKAQSKTLSLGSNISSTEIRKIGDIMEENIQRANQPAKASQNIPIHLESIKLFKTGQFIVLAARPAHGKSALALDMCRKVAKQNIPVGCYSLEMKDSENAQRVWQGELSINSEHFDNNEFERDELNDLIAVKNEYANIPLYVDSNPSLSILEFRAKARRMKKIYGVKMIVVDYIQLMEGLPEYKGKKVESIGSITRGLKTTAMELDVVIIGISQLARPEKSVSLKNQIPKLTELKGSGDIEQDADIAILLTNFNELGLKEWCGEDTAGKAILDIAKRRDRKGGVNIIHHSSNCMNWSDNSLLSELPF